MKKLLFIFIILTLILGCSNSKLSDTTDLNDVKQKYSVQMLNSRGKQVNSYTIKVKNLKVFRKNNLVVVCDSEKDKEDEIILCFEKAKNQTFLIRKIIVDK